MHLLVETFYPLVKTCRARRERQDMRQAMRLGLRSAPYVAEPRWWQIFATSWEQMAIDRGIYRGAKV